MTEYYVGSRRLESGEFFASCIECGPKQRFMICQANVMISPDGTAMIAGFGNAHMRGLTLQYTNTTNTAFSIRWAVRDQVSRLNKLDDLR